MNALANKIASIFTEKFSATPTLYFSPGRINLIGEHIDYNDGFVLPAAIDKGVYYAVSRNEDATLNFYAADFNEAFSTNIAGVKKNKGWKNYVLSVVNEFILLNKNVGGFNCVLGGDIPRGSGLSSSAAVEGGLATAINDLFQCALSKKELALLCQRAEHNYPGVQCGIMDQYANIFGLQDQVILLDCMNITHEYFPLQVNGYKIVLINSKVHHSLAAGEYNLRRQQCEEGLDFLKANMLIHSFRDIASWEELMPFKDSMNETVFNRCLFVVQEIDRTKRAALYLKDNRLEDFGELMYGSHEGLSKLYQVSCKELDFLAAYARNDENVIGSRMMGGGFGGCTINIVKEEAADQFIKAISVAYEMQFSVHPENYQVKIGNGVSRL